MRAGNGWRIKRRSRLGCEGPLGLDTDGNTLKTNVEATGLGQL